MRKVIFNSDCRILPPGLFRGGLEGVVTTDGYIVCYGRDKFSFEDRNDVPPAGTECVVKFGFGDSIVAITAEDRRAAAETERRRNEEIRLRHEERQRIADARRAARDEEDRAFNAALMARIPFEWGPDHRVVMSGLTERGHGSGDYARTSIHVGLREPMRMGRIVREAGQFLCSADRGRLGTAAGSYGDVSSDLRVTCPKCLAIVDRLWPQA